MNKIQKASPIFLFITGGSFFIPPLRLDHSFIIALSLGLVAFLSFHSMWLLELSMWLHDFKYRMKDNIHDLKEFQTTKFNITNQCLISLLAIIIYNFLKYNQSSLVSFVVFLNFILNLSILLFTRKAKVPFKEESLLDKL